MNIAQRWEFIATIRHGLMKELDHPPPDPDPLEEEDPPAEEPLPPEDPPPTERET